MRECIIYSNGLLHSQRCRYRELWEWKRTSVPSLVSPCCTAEGVEGFLVAVERKIGLRYVGGMKTRAAEVAEMLTELYPVEDRPGAQAAANLSAEKLQQRNARAILNRAVKSGAVVSQPCEGCGLGGEWPSNRRLMQAHHEDYARPLDIVWVCWRCHAKAHTHSV